MARCAASAAPRTAALFSSRSARAASPAAWNAAARPVVCALLYWSAAWLATSTAWLLGVDLGQLGREERGECLVGGTRVARGGGGVAGRRPPRRRRGRAPPRAPARPEPADRSVSWRTTSAAPAAPERDDEQDHGADEQRRALPPAATVAATGGVGALAGVEDRSRCGHAPACRKQVTTWSSASPAACMNAYTVVGPTNRKPRRLRSLLSAVDCGVDDGSSPSCSPRADDRRAVDERPHVACRSCRARPAPRGRAARC